MSSHYECRYVVPSVPSGHSGSYKAREGEMMRSDDTKVYNTESTRAISSRTSDTLVRDSGCSSRISPRARKRYLSTEVIFATQTRTNSLQFKTRLEEEGVRPRSASFCLPNSKNAADDDDDDAAEVLWKFNFGRRGGMCPRTRKMPLREYKDLEEEERRWNFGKKKRVVRTEDVPEELRTSVMLRCIPHEYTRGDVFRLLQDHDFGEINFLYLLTNFKTGLNAGYAFINFRFPEDAWEFKSSFTGRTFCEKKPEQTADVRWRCPIQGFASHFDQFRHSGGNSPSHFKPTMIRDGKEMDIPKVRIW